MTSETPTVGPRKSTLTRMTVGLALAGLLSLGGTSMAQATPTDPKIASINRFFEAYAKNDQAGIREVLDDNVRWTIPGHHPLSGTKVGVNEVLAFFTALSKTGFKAEPLFLEASKEYVVDIHHGYSTLGEGKVDTLWALVWHFNEQGKVYEVFNLSMDQHQMDAFIWQNFPLKPLPDRLQTP